MYILRILLNFTVGVEFWRLDIVRNYKGPMCARDVSLSTCITYVINIHFSRRFVSVPPR